MISRVTTDMATERARIPKLKFCLIPRVLNDGRWIWMERAWVVRKGKHSIYVPVTPQGEWTMVPGKWGYYLDYDEALVNHWEFGK